MSGYYFIGAAQGARWTFTPEQLMQAARELRPGAQVDGGPAGAEIDLPDPRSHTIEYWTGKAPAIMFKEDDSVPETAALVLELLQRLEPATPSVWFADFIDGTEHTFQPQDLTTAEFIRAIWGEPA